MQKPSSEIAFFFFFFYHGNHPLTSLYVENLGMTLYIIEKHVGFQ